MLLAITSIVNFVALAAALWLGLYVVTRSPRRLTSWLTGLTLWSLTGPFLNILLTLTPLPTPTGSPGWLGPVLQFWEANVRDRANSWLHGWSAIPAIVFWHHATVLMRPGGLNRWRRTRILFGYGFGVLAIIVQSNTSLLISSTLAVDPLYLSTSRTGPLYPLFLTLGLLLMGMSLVNLMRSAYIAPTNVPRKQFVTLTAATLIAGLALPLSSAGWLLGLRIPTFVGSMLLGLAVVLIGYGVARYSALVDGRTIRRDFYYNAVAIGVVTVLYLFVTWISVQFFGVPGVTFIFVVLLAIVTHSLVDVTRRYLNPFFYRRDIRQVRADLHKLASIAGEHDRLDEHLSITLDSLCTSVRAIFGLILLFEDSDGTDVRIAAGYRWHYGNPPLSPQDLTADDVLHLKPGQFFPPLTEAALLIPLYADTEQCGALILGQPTNGTSYSQADVDLLLYPSDRLTDAIRDARRKAEYVAQVAQVIETSEPQTIEYPDPISIKSVEDALRHIVDYAYLGDHPLTRFKLVRSRIAAGTSVTHLDLGKAAYDVLSEAVEKLRPGDTLPGDPPPREWYPYLILHDAYLQDVPNRDIMSRLYISEGTFNRTRRTALRAVTRALEEMESALH
ncbi:MAG: hypothetical protein GY832_06425 [Chloroflexi bacterium]|nr:hypothetical protein [Chloroflexota bacterium]